MINNDIKNIINDIENEYQKDIKLLNHNSLYLKYLGKKGVINSQFKEIQNLTQDLKVQLAKKLNTLKTKIEKEIAEIENTEKSSKNELFDMTIPVSPTVSGNLHPITIVTRDLYQFFHYYGFSVFDGPEIEDDKHNFEMMGVPENHPARELQDTLYIMEPEALLRTQTSSIEARELEKQTPPIRFVTAGKVYRNETESKSNGAVFHQFQGVCVDKNITLANLKWIFEKSFKFILGEDTKIRFRSKYYPEVEPGLSPDIQCTFCRGDGCEICKNRGWIEIAGGGMIHAKTLEMSGIDSKQYSGFAFGWGLDRIAMARFNIKDIRLLMNGNIVYTNQK
ncbi:phenylalanine--tRNA ligase subunit alpha [candidate division WWE3 bacterium CG_4_9_14_3_um_filter_34_6]|uniref:phenylalanine--tRNA ligase n=1 Tax=candidate division WWE3 bacterium CG_4_9_14_3_um_filter_34_6 TaxID=1975079 RepID=A0A2M7X4W0_UNCKA|nr:MAG: phenylalanine--tRNA ligase subunit alpha [candidate division WWE3 bacterium CG_4_9_14_3_um_filter_34_6]